jgi:hypothetical protein
MVVGKDISTAKITHFVGRTLVGCLNGKSTSETALNRWMELH